MKIKEFLLDPSSTTGYFLQLSHNYQLTVLRHGINGKYFERVIAIFLDRMPCMVAVSKTQINFPVFLDILQNSGQVPIGTRLFAANSGITRTNLEVSIIGRDMINDPTILSFIKQLELNDPELYYRKSDFVCAQQKMHLTEYALPALGEILVNCDV